MLELGFENHHKGFPLGLTFELSGRRRQDARPGLAKMYRVPPDRAWRPAVGAPLERGVRRQNYHSSPQLTSTQQAHESLCHLRHAAPRRVPDCFARRTHLHRRSLPAGRLRHGLSLQTKCTSIHGIDWISLFWEGSSCNTRESLHLDPCQSRNSPDLCAVAAPTWLEIHINHSHGRRWAVLLCSSGGPSRFAPSARATAV